MISLTNNYGYSELYELDNDLLNYFVKSNTPPFGRFVQFNNKEPFDNIILCSNPSEYIGVTSTNPSFISNNQVEWPGKYYVNYFGETIYQKTGELVKAKLQTIDEGNDNLFNIISTYNEGYTHPLINESFDNNQQYISRLDRVPWIPVTIIGKCIVVDNGECVPGKYCTINYGENYNECGIAIPALDGDKVKFKVLERFSEKSIVIFLK